MQANTRIRTSVVAWILASLTAIAPLASAGSYSAGSASHTGTEAAATATEIHEIIQESAPGALILSYRWSYSESDNSKEHWNFEFTVSFTGRASLNKEVERDAYDQAGSTDSGTGNLLLTWSWSSFAGQDAGGLNRAHATRYETGWCCGGPWSVASEAEKASPIEVDVVQAGNPSN